MSNNIRYFAIVAALVASTSAHASSFDTRAAAFFASVRESANEYNCQPHVCHAKAAKLGLVWHEDFRVCDVGDTKRCAIPKF